MNKMTKFAAVLTILVFNTQAMAQGNFCANQIKRFVKNTYTINQVASVKEIKQPYDLAQLNPIERGALRVHLKMAKKPTYGFEDGNRHAVSVRHQEVNGQKWLVLDVTSDNRMGLTRTIQIYKYRNRNLKPVAVYFDDHFNEPLYRCQN